MQKYVDWFCQSKFIITEHLAKYRHYFYIWVSRKLTCRTRWKECTRSHHDRSMAPLSLVFIITSLLLLPRFSKAEGMINTLGVWENEVSLEENRRFVIQWTPHENRIIFRVTARTNGYIGFGFHSKPKMDGSDIVVGWVHSGKIYLQDRHGKGNEQPFVDQHQDWDLIGGFENDTHTVLTMARPYVTCDPHDYSITNDTVKLLWAYHPDDPIDPESPKPRLHYHGMWRRGVKTLFLLQRASGFVSTRPLMLNKPKTYYNQEATRNDDHVHSWSLVGPEATIEGSVDSVHWCRLFQRPQLTRKHHVIKYEPVLVGENHSLVHHMMVYECIRLPSEEEEFFAMLVKTEGGVCSHKKMQILLSACNHVVVAWALGSEGVWLPPEAGYPLIPEGPVFYMLETHYNMSSGGSAVNDSSGVRLLHTPFLRNYDAGVLSVGLHPNWKHIIPPRQPSVVSEGHCIPECTHSAFPSTGIEIFGVIFHTHLLGRKVRLRHVRGDAELEPIASDSNYDFTYQEYRALSTVRNILPGDHLISECVYNSEKCSSITLGGFKTREEMCLSFVFYYPKVDLSFCHSKPSLGTVLLSLGIQELSDQSQPITIRLPAELAGKTLKWRLQNYDWENHFEHFQSATRNGTFNVMCRGHNLAPVLNQDYHSPNISRRWQPVDVCEGMDFGGRISEDLGWAVRGSESRPSQRPDGASGRNAANRDVMAEGGAKTKLIERLDVDPVSDFDVFMPVIGGPDGSSDTSGGSEDMSVSEEFDLIDREVGDELMGGARPPHPPTDEDQQRVPPTTQASTATRQISVGISLFTLISVGVIFGQLGS